MIHAIELSSKKFIWKYSLGGKGTKSGASPSKAADSNVMHSILNNIPTAPIFYLIYNYKDFKDNISDATYSIPKAGEFGVLQKLKSLKAVIKEICDGNTIFSHMLVLLGDTLNPFDEEFMKAMKR